MTKYEDINPDGVPQTKPLMYGDATFDVDRLDEIERVEMNYDNSYIEGYSEARMENDIRMRQGLEPIEMDRLLWIRVSTTEGLDSMSDRGKWARLGYQLVMGDHKDQSCQCLLDRSWGGPKGLPASSHVSRDGMIRREDSALAIVDSEVARRNRERRNKKLRVENQETRNVGAISEVGRGNDNKRFRGSLNEAFTNLPSK